MTVKEKKLVKFRNIHKNYDELEVLKGINLDIHEDEKVDLIGPSGSGKTTLARLLMTLENPTEGTIEVDGKYLWHEEVKGKLVKASARHLSEVRGNIGMVFQHFHLFPHMTVLQNVMEAPVSVLGQNKAEAKAEAVEMIDKVGLSDKLDTYPAQLSGGQKQRVAIARALVMKPKIMIFDEPTSALDPELVGEVLAVIKEIALEGKMGMLLITHEMDFALDIADRVIFFDEGIILEQGPPQDLFYNPQTERLQSFLSRFSDNGARQNGE